MFPTNL